MKTATVLIPTHDHGPLITRALASARAQTVEDLEILVVGDGVPDITRDIMADAIRRDPRVRFFDHPKGDRHGEAYRHRALKEADGRIVCYLSDDDLWLPEHVATLAFALMEADFVSALPLRVPPQEGPLESWAVDISQPYFKNMMLSGTNRVPLSCGAHTLEAYRRLPRGWVPAPRTTYTDLYMWNQFLREPWCRAHSSLHPTILHFPTPLRRPPEWNLERRCRELDEWQAKIQDPVQRSRLVSDGLDLARHYRALAQEWVAKDRAGR